MSSMIRDETLRAAVLGALKTTVEGEYNHARGQTLTTLLDAWHEMGVKSVDVSLPDGTPVAAITLVMPSPEVRVVDRGAFVNWVRGRAPHKVTQEESPRARVAQALRSEVPELNSAAAVNAASVVLATLGIDSQIPDPQVDPKYESQILEEVKEVTADIDPADDGHYPVVLPDTGEVVPGVGWYPAGDPDRFQLRYKTGGRDAIVAAWRANRLPRVEGLPEVQS